MVTLIGGDRDGNVANVKNASHKSFPIIWQNDPDLKWNGISNCFLRLRHVSMSHNWKLVDVVVESIEFLNQKRL